MANGNNGDNPTKRKRTRSKAVDKVAAKLKHIQLIAENCTVALPTISEVLVDEELELKHFQIKMNKDGRYMALLSYSNKPRDQIAFGVGDSPVEALHGLEMRILERGYSDAYSYEERQQMKSKE